jgi:hypothetical protein
MGLKITTKFSVKNWYKIDVKMMSKLIAKSGVKNDAINLYYKLIFFKIIFDSICLKVSDPIYLNYVKTNFRNIIL